jgi:hypothetical protein
MGAILTFRASFGAITMQQSIKLLNHSIKLVEKCHPMPSRVERRRLWLAVDVNDCAIVTSWCGGHRSSKKFRQLE